MPTCLCSGGFLPDIPWLLLLNLQVKDSWQWAIRFPWLGSGNVAGASSGALSEEMPTVQAPSYRARRIKKTATPVAADYPCGDARKGGRRRGNGYTCKESSVESSPTSVWFLVRVFGRVQGTFVSGVTTSAVFVNGDGALTVAGGSGRPGSREQCSSHSTCDPFARWPQTG